jgi:hypothetical protein
MGCKKHEEKEVAVVGRGLLGRRTVFLVVVSCCTVAGTQIASGGPLNLPPSFPDISAQGLTVGYDASGAVGVFTATGSGIFGPANYKDGTNAYAIGDATLPDLKTYSLSADIDKTTGQLTGTGSISIAGKIDGLGIPFQDPLLSGNSPFAFGWTTGSAPVFEFIFTTNNASYLGPQYPQIGVIVSGLTSNPDFDGDFTTSWSFGSNGQTDNRATPEPSFVLFWLAIVLPGAAIGFRRWHRRVKLPKMSSKAAEAGELCAQ